MVAPPLGEVEIWVVTRPEAGDVERDATTLSAQEIEHYASFEGNARTLAIATRVALRQLLGQRLALAPEAVEIVEGEAKPALAGGALEFSVAHSDGLALVAMAEVAVGVDVERVEPIGDEEFDDLVAFVLAEDELENLVRLPEDERLGAYYRVWTRKEAFVKATGEGIGGRPLPEVVVGVAAPALVEVAGLAPDELSHWSVLDVEVPAGYVASLVARHPEPSLIIRPWART